MKKNISYLLLIITLSFIFTPNVNALKFKNAYKYSDWTLKKADDGSLAYCLHGTRSFPSKETNFDPDEEWNSWKCRLEYNDENGNPQRKESDDCERIMGYILREVNVNYPPSENSIKNHSMGQQAVWNYLANFDVNNKYYPSNWDYKGLENAYDGVQKSIKDGMQNYYDQYILKKNPIENVNIKEVDFTVEVPNKNLKYNPMANTTSYISEPIKITNNMEKKISLELYISKTSQNNINICINGSCQNSYQNIELSGGDSRYIKVQSTKDFDDTFDLVVKAKYYIGDKSNSSLIIPTTKAYKKTGDSRIQSVIIYREEEIPIEQSIETPKTLTFQQNKERKVKNAICSGISKENGNKTIENKTQCVNNAEGKAQTATYQACKKITLKKDNGDRVDVIVKESSGFIYGNLIYKPNQDGTLSSGLGFRLVGDGDPGVKTKYKSEVTWTYADYYEDNGEIYSIGTFTKDEITNLIKEKLNNKINLSFNPIDSNDSTKTKEYNLEVNLTEKIEDYSEKVSSSNVTLPGQKITLENSMIVLNESYFASDGHVQYVKNGEIPDSKHTISGGNYYYIPLNYMGKEFNFKITDSKLNSFADFSFKYTTEECDVPTGSGDTVELRYRSIDVKKPFPKEIPTNWSKWYENSSNKQRIANSYENYDSSNALYSITLTRETINAIRNNQIDYSNWSDIKQDGTSGFINSNSPEIKFDKKTGNTSYCGLGVFKESCDQR